MEREMINEVDTEKVIGGSIMFNEDCSTCGRNKDDEYKVLDLNGVISYINANKKKMSEKQMISKMLEQGLLANL